MCSSYRSNQNPQTVKLSTPSSVHISRRFPTSPICYDFDADAPKPPTYPFNNSIFKERSVRQNNTKRANFLATLVRLVFRFSGVFRAAFASVRSRHRRCFASVRRLFTAVRRNPQEEKTHPFDIFFALAAFPYNIWGLPGRYHYQAGRRQRFVRLSVNYPTVVQAQTRLRGPLRYRRTASSANRIAA